MPTYEYICEKCGHEFEAKRSMSAPPLKECPEELCARKKWGHGRVSKKIGAGAGLLFKGSGFYITDYRSEGYKSAAKSETGEAKPKTEPKAETAAKPEPKADSKPAKKAEKK
jgi:putative FmdB family regulatory protein